MLSHIFTARDLWKKRYFEEKKRTNPLEEKANKLRVDLDALHRRIMSQLETQKERESLRKNTEKDKKPSQQVDIRHRFYINIVFTITNIISAIPPFTICTS